MIKVLCPKCKSELVKCGNVMSCTSGYCYDIAREGYVNLLLSDKKNSKNPGDNKQMVLARDAFLENGYYGFLAEYLAKAVLKSGASTVLDAGCGSGYYLRRILGEVTAEVIGVDISKEAVKLASKRDNRARYAVASVYDLPFADNSFDFISCVFSPYAYKEYARVLRAGGTLAVAYPAGRHLIEIKKLLYGDSVFENDKEVSSEYFKTVSLETLTQKIQIADNADLMSLVEMTPYFYKTKAEKIQALKEVENLAVTVSFNVALLQKI